MKQRVRRAFKHLIEATPQRDNSNHVIRELVASRDDFQRQAVERLQQIDAYECAAIIQSELLQGVEKALTDALHPPVLDPEQQFDMKAALNAHLERIEAVVSTQDNTRRELTASQKQVDELRTRHKALLAEISQKDIAMMECQVCIRSILRELWAVEQDTDSQRMLNTLVRLREGFTELTRVQVNLRQTIATLTEELEDRLKGTECIICMNAPREILFTPCGHVVCCTTCAPAYHQERCPICRVNVCCQTRVFL